MIAEKCPLSSGVAIYKLQTHFSNLTNCTPKPRMHPAHITGSTAMTLIASCCRNSDRNAVCSTHIDAALMAGAPVCLSFQHGSKGHASGLGAA